MSQVPVDTPVDEPPMNDMSDAPRPGLRLFAAAREAAGTGSDRLPGATVAAVLDAARTRYGPEFAAVLAGCRVWVNGSPAELSTAVGDADEIAVLPPVSGGA